MNTDRLVTVLMPVYNAEKYLQEAIDSVLTQSFKDFQLLIIDDCSLDNSESIINSYKDNRIIYYRNPKNLGLAGALNVGLGLINSKYIIRMDGDDISVPERFKLLVEYMEANAEIGVLSSALVRFGKIEEHWSFPEKDAEIKALLLFGPSIAHAPCIIRTEVLKSKGIEYRDIHLHMEDYDLWLRLQGLTNFANLPLILYRYRLVENSITISNLDTLLERRKKIYNWLLNNFGIFPSDEELIMHISLTYKIKDYIYPSPDKYHAWLNKLFAVNEQSRKYNTIALKEMMQQKWNRLFYFYLETNRRYALKYLRYPNKNRKKFSIYILKYLIKKFFFLNRIKNS